MGALEILDALGVLEIPEGRGFLPNRVAGVEGGVCHEHLKRIGG